MRVEARHCHTVHLLAATVNVDVAKHIDSHAADTYLTLTVATRLPEVSGHYANM